jgi:membrane protein involved in colicin uptake
MSTEDRIKTLQAQIEVLQAKQAELNKQLVQAEIERWQGRIDDIELQMHLGAMETNDRLRELLDQLRRRWMDAKAQIEGTTSAAGETADQVRASLQTAYKDIRQALLDTKNKITS